MPATRNLPRSLAVGSALGLVVACLLGGFLWLGVFETPELLVFDAMQRGAAEPALADDDIVLLTVDQGSIEKVEQTLGHRYPWPRALHTLMLDYIEQGGPRAVIFDLLFEGSSPGSEEQDGHEQDAELSAAIRRADNVGLAVKLRPADPTPATSVSMSMLERTALPGRAWLELPFFERIDPLAVELIESGARFGFVNAFPEADGVVRRANLLARVGGRLVPALTLAPLLKIGPAAIDSAEQSLLVDGKKLPISSDGRAWIRFHGKGGIRAGRGRTYRYIPFANVLLSAIQAKQGGVPILKNDVFDGKWVIIGSTAAAGFDLKATPFSKAGAYPGMEIQATILDNLLHGDFLWRVPRWLVILLLVAGCMLTGVLGSVLRSISWSMLALVGGLGGYVLLSLLFFKSGVLLDVVAVECGIFITFAAITYLNFLRERRGRKRVRSLFQYYLDPALVGRILGNRERLKLGGESRVCSVLFSDIVGFTSIAEKLSPEQVVAVMNRYLGEMTEIILSNGGLLDKYIGDAIMAVYGAPADMPEHARAACLTALESQKRLVELSRQLVEEGLTELTCGVGVNSGPMVVGNIGSATRGNYTAMGDAVNLASRIEGLTREFNVGIIIGPGTQAALGDDFVTRELDFIRVKGKREPVRIYELVCQGEAPARQAERFSIFERGIEAYRAKDFHAAHDHFTKVLEGFPGDGPSKTYLARCTACIADPPGADWDGVFVMTTK